MLKRHRDLVVVHASHGAFVALIEPCVGFGDLGGGHDDHVVEVVLGADVGEVVCHGVTLVDAVFSVYFFFRLFSDFNHHPVVVAEVASAVAALCKRREVVRLHLNHLADVRHCLGLSLAAREVHRAVRLAILHRDEGHAVELVYLDDLDVVLHGQTMVENSVAVNSFRYFFSLFFQISF